MPPFSGKHLVGYLVVAHYPHIPAGIGWGEIGVESDKDVEGLDLHDRITVMDIAQEKLEGVG